MQCRAELLSAHSRFEALKAAVLAAEERMRKEAEEHQRQLAEVTAQLDRCGQHSLCCQT